MATPRGPRGFSSNRPSAAVSRVYEKFTPSSEWKQEKESDILLIFLPDFLKQNIRVTTEPGNILRVTGERPVGGNKLSRFQEDFAIPKNCIIKAIRAKFEGGILSITFPRIANTAAATTKTTTTTTTTEKPKASQPNYPTSPPSQEQDKKEATKAAIPDTPAALPTPALKEPTSKTTQTPALPTPVLKEPTSQTTKAAIPRTPALPSPEPKELERSRFQSPPKPTKPSNFDADLPKKPIKFIESSRPPLVVDDKTPLLPTLATGKGTINEEVVKGKDNVKNENTEKKEGDTNRNGLEKRGSIEKVEDVKTNNENDEKESKKIVEKSDEVDLKLLMKSVGRRIREEKETVVNMGAAVMVIVGLGAYVYHSFSSGKLAKR